MNELLWLARSFQHRIAPDQEPFRTFAAGQSPSTLFITCSDSRVVPTLITAAGPGELFELRNAGNMVPPYAASRGSGEAATIEYAVQVLKVGDIVVCGHSHCGAVGALAHGEDLSSLPSMGSWLAFAEPALTPLLGTPPEDPALSEWVQLHVAAQLEKLRRYPCVAQALTEDRLTLHGWFYRVDTGEVEELHEAQPAGARR
jgi:carbonic anhydrase